jgi:hypothetical protein
MRGYTAGLGVQCNYCHIQEGRGGRNDFATDEKQPKKTARVMITMMNHVNETLATGLGKPAADITKVQCAPRHRGEALPKNPPPPPPPALLLRVAGLRRQGSRSSREFRILNFIPFSSVHVVIVGGNRANRLRSASAWEHSGSFRPSSRIVLDAASL